MSRKLDSEGEVTDPRAKDTDGGGGLVEPLFIEVPLWRFGRISFKCQSEKASLAVIAIILIFVALLPLSIIEAFGGGSGVGEFIGALGKALMLALGVLLGSTEVTRDRDL